MSSAWLIRRFIDPKASFAFGGPPGKPLIPFDMFGAEFGHRGASCTFETIAQRFGIEDPAVAWLGRLVHDLDLKEDTYDLPEKAAVARMIEGLRRIYHEDQTLLTQGMTMFEALYQSYEHGARPKPRSRKRSIVMKTAKSLLLVSVLSVVAMAPPRTISRSAGGRTSRSSRTTASRGGTPEAKDTARPPSTSRTGSSRMGSNRPARPATSAGRFHSRKIVETRSSLALVRDGAVTPRAGTKRRSTCGDPRRKSKRRWSSPATA